jgi:septal ring factor EnvC (AmiA/AmiB activator)
MLDIADDIKYTTAVALWATLQAHDSMDLFLNNGEFADHPALTAEHVKFLTHPTSQSGEALLGSEMHAIEASIEKSSKAIREHMPKTDTTNAKLRELEKEIESLELNV